jgi:hypothetical protein
MPPIRNLVIFASAVGFLYFLLKLYIHFHQH